VLKHQYINMMLYLIIDIIFHNMYHNCMRTTLSLDDDLLPVVRSYAESRSIPIGKAVSQLVRKGLSSPTPTRMVDGFVVFDVPPDEPRITTDKVRELESELE
jgi:hypothetical protein